MKVLLFGNSGSGKTTFARRMAARYSLAMLDLDQVVWSRAEFATFRPDAEIISDLETFVAEQRAWVMEGCYGRWIEYLQPNCTEMVFLNPGEATCLAHCHARPWEPDKYPTRADQNAHLAFLLDWVRGYYTRSDDLSLAAHRRIFEAFPGPKREILNDQSSTNNPLLS